MTDESEEESFRRFHQEYLARRRLGYAWNGLVAVADGRTYESLDSLMVAACEGGEPGEPCYLEEALFKHPDGTWFVAGTGGTETRWADSGRGVIFLTTSAAREWLEEAGAPDEEIALQFGRS